MDAEFKAQTLKAIHDLHSTNKKSLNRLLACEAMLHSLIQLLDRQGLAALGEEYHQAVDRLASQLPPQFQERQYWGEFATAIEDRAQHLQRQADRQRDAG